MITLTLQGTKITIFINHINSFMAYHDEVFNCRIWTTAQVIDVEETYEQVLALINNALK